MEEFPGQRHDNSSVYFYNGERYHLDSRYQNTPHKYYRCPYRGNPTNCKAYVFRSPTGVCTRYGYHNHLHNATARDDCVYKEEIRVIAQDITLQPEEIIRRASVLHPAAGLRCKVGALKSFIKRIRLQMLPRIPDTVEELGHILEGYDPVAPIYRGMVTAEGSSALIFASLQMLAFLQVAQWLHIDGTFSGYAAVFVLCERRTRAMYDAIWNKVLELAPNLRTNLRGVWTDFEAGAIGSIRAKFPRIKIRGCLFHFCRATYRKWKSLKMNNPPKEILHLSWGLPLLPPNRFAEGCQAITAIADHLAVDAHRKLNDFTHYLRRQWVPLVDVVSLFGTPIRTNNVAEAFNRRAPTKLGGSHPNLWVFLQKLNETIDNEVLKLRRWRENGEVNEPRRPQNWLRVDERINSCQENLHSGRFTVEEFLREVTTRDQRLDLHDRIRRNPADNETEWQVPAAADILDPENVFEDDPAEDQRPQARGPRPGRRNAVVAVETDGSGNEDDHPLEQRPQQGPRREQRTAVMVDHIDPAADRRPTRRCPSAAIVNNTDGSGREDDPVRNRRTRQASTRRNRTVMIIDDTDESGHEDDPVQNHRPRQEPRRRSQTAAIVIDTDESGHEDDPARNRRIGRESSRRSQTVMTIDDTDESGHEDDPARDHGPRREPRRRSQIPTIVDDTDGSGHEEQHLDNTIYGISDDELFGSDNDAQEAVDNVFAPQAALRASTPSPPPTRNITRATRAPLIPRVVQIPPAHSVAPVVPAPQVLPAAAAPPASQIAPVPPARRVVPATAAPPAPQIALARQTVQVAPAPSTSHRALPLPAIRVTTAPLAFPVADSDSVPPARRVVPATAAPPAPQIALARQTVQVAPAPSTSHTALPLPAIRVTTAPLAFEVADSDSVPPARRVIPATAAPPAPQIALVRQTVQVAPAPSTSHTALPLPAIRVTTAPLAFPVAHSDSVLPQAPAPPFRRGGDSPKAGPSHQRKRRRPSMQPPPPPPPPASEKNRKRNARRKKMKQIALAKQQENSVQAAQAIRLAAELEATRQQLQEAQGRLAAIEDNALCRICYGQVATHCFLPCGHRVCCEACGIRWWELPSRHCAFCREPITEAPRRVYP